MVNSSGGWKAKRVARGWEGIIVGCFLGVEKEKTVEKKNRIEQTEERSKRHRIFLKRGKRRRPPLVVSSIYTYTQLEAYQKVGERLPEKGATETGTGIR